jgi:SAM-dependent methyltransferase
MPFVAYRIFGWQPIEITEGWGLRDLTLGHAYAVCNTLTCLDCGLLFLDMRFDDEEMEALYAGYRCQDYCNTRERFEPGYAARNELLAAGSPYIGMIEAFLAPHLPERPRVLDWGGDTGLNTPFKGRATTHHVYDISDKPMVAGASRVAREDLAREHYDLIVLSNVLEHVPQPRRLLNEIVSIMRHDTVVYIEVPHEDIIRTPKNPTLHKRHWHEHVNFFTEEALNRLHEACRLEIVERATHKITAGGKDAHVFSILSRLARRRT